MAINSKHETDKIEEIFELTSRYETMPKKRNKELNIFVWEWKNENNNQKHETVTHSFFPSHKSQI